MNRFLRIPGSCDPVCSALTSPLPTACVSRSVRTCAEHPSGRHPSFGLPRSASTLRPVTLRATCYHAFRISHIRSVSAHLVNLCKSRPPPSGRLRYGPLARSLLDFRDDPEPRSFTHCQRRAHTHSRTIYLSAECPPAVCGAWVGGSSPRWGRVHDVRNPVGRKACL